MSTILPDGPERCNVCGAEKNPDWSRLCRHHIDGNDENDVVENLQWMCRKHHAQHHAQAQWEDPEYRAKMSAAHKGKKLSDETKEKISAAKMGRKRPPFTPETKAKMSTAKKGAQNPMYGKHHSAETRAKIGDAHRGRKLSDEHRAAISRGKREHTR